jgi:hypothetical protein
MLWHDARPAKLKRSVAARYTLMMHWLIKHWLIKPWLYGKR